jgi:acetyltransferase-like isoleucine patch superfamily enzyme/glycosyltransferase involved in cell wall biosynthesis
MTQSNAASIEAFSATSRQRTVPVSVVILTLNEETNIPGCLASCAWSDDVHVLDAGSTDGTVEIARAANVSVHTHPFKSFGEQRNWAIDNIPHKHEWVFHLDADERFTPELVEEISRILARDPVEACFYAPHKLMFMGRWLKWSEGYPIYQMRFFHMKRARFRDYGHGQREETTGKVGSLTRPYLHYNFSKGIEDWVYKHNRYSTLEAEIIFKSGEKGLDADTSWAFGSAIQRRRFLKARIYPKLPGKWVGRFIYMYFIKLGFLDGIPGLHYSLLVSAYELFTSLKLAELKKKAAGAMPELGEITVVSGPREIAAESSPAQRAGPSGNGEAAPGDNGRSQATRATQPAPQPVVTELAASPWTFRENLQRVAWMIVRATLFRCSFHNWYGWRRFLLRCFGAKIGAHVRIRPTVSIEMPWNLVIDDQAVVGDFAILYSLGKISIGRRVVISQYAHLCAGTHDYRHRTFPLLRPPIVVEDDAWVAADAFIGPGVRVGARSVVGARATAVKDVPADQVVAGNPAKPIKPRELFD